MNVKEKGAEPCTQKPRIQVNDNTVVSKLDLFKFMLSLFATGSNCHELLAELIGDCCLDATIIMLEDIHSIRFSREIVNLPSGAGSEITVWSYCLQGRELEKARKIAWAVGAAS